MSNAHRLELTIEKKDEVDPFYKLTHHFFNFTSTTPTMRIIEVTGQHEELYIPDEIVFAISIEEYWAEEFEEDKKQEDYRTKVEITAIEDSLMLELASAGITMDMITLNSTGNGWRERGKDFLISKNFDIKLPSMVLANQLSNTLSTRGIRNMSVKERKVSNMAAHQLDAKVEAVKVAQQKAEKLAAAVGKKVKDVISIVEVDAYAGVSPKPVAKTAMLRSTAAGGGAQYENFKKVKVKAVVRVVWEIE